ncbi:MAG: hypothetical protein JWM37_354 [Candidatus Saccharibacteria bacterium]|nr:hypothetical protein [Candidatus Saccharibacteria bacterium]
MKIGIVCPYNIARGGGVQEVVLALCKDLNRRGHTAKIITPQPRELESVEENPNIIFLGGSADLYSPMHTLAQVSASISNEAIDAVLEAEQFDLLHFHEPWVPMLSRQILARSKSVNVATFHAKIPETIMSQTVMKAVMPYLKSVLKYLDEITAVSDAAAEYISTMTDQDIKIIPNGIDLKTYAQKDVRPDTPNKNILYIGRLEKRKGVKYLIKAFQLLQTKHPEAKLIIAGDGPDREKLEDMVGDLQLPNVQFLGYISDEQKHELLATADLFCSPAIFGESFGIVLLEAMAYDLPVVAGNNAGYSSVMQGVGGLSLINPEDSAEFSRRLEMLLYEPAIIKLWSTWAKQYVKRFNYPAVIDEYEEAYKLAIKHHAVNPPLLPVQ